MSYRLYPTHATRRVGIRIPGRGSITRVCTKCHATNRHPTAPQPCPRRGGPPKNPPVGPQAPPQAAPAEKTATPTLAPAYPGGSAGVGVVCIPAADEAVADAEAMP